jgi:hypothetical protein
LKSQSTNPPTIAFVLSAALGVYELRADHVLAQDLGAEAVLVEGERLEAVVDRQGVREW